jgi:hypothetical protein
MERSKGIDFFALAVLPVALPGGIFSQDLRAGRDIYLQGSQVMGRDIPSNDSNFNFAVFQQNFQKQIIDRIIGDSTFKYARMGIELIALHSEDNTSYIKFFTQINQNGRLDFTIERKVDHHAVALYVVFYNDPIQAPLWRAADFDLKDTDGKDRFQSEYLKELSRYDINYDSSGNLSFRITQQWGPSAEQLKEMGY